MRTSACLALPLLLAFRTTPCQQPSAVEIMGRVAEYQDRSEAERSHFVYLQHATVASRRGRKLLCEEITDTRVTPTQAGSRHDLLTLQGRLWHKGHYLPYTHPLADKPKPGEVLEVDLGDDGDNDVDLVEHLRHGTLIDERSKDGIQAGLFPLTSKALPVYDYRLVGREAMNGRDTFHLTFRPKDNSDFDWQGDAWIDSTAFQPVLVRTRLSRGIPFAVKALLGTNVPGLGFAVTYAPQPDGTWFPVTFGTEFKIHVLFFFNREITISATNRDFQKTHVDTRILTEQSLE